MATAFLAIANWPIAAPLNPADEKDEFAFYFQNLNATFLICGDANDPAALAAKSLGIKVALAGVSETFPAGIFTLEITAGARRSCRRSGMRCGSRLVWVQGQVLGLND